MIHRVLLIEISDGLCDNNEFFRERTKMSTLLASFSFLRDDVADDELSRRSQNEEHDLTGSCVR